MPAGGEAGLEATGRTNGANRWIELRMFEVLGGWVPTTPEPEMKMIFDRHSFHHAWRASQWWDRLPVVAGTDPVELSSAPGPGWRAAMEELAGFTTTVERAAGAYRLVLPRLAARYRAQQGATDPVGDGSTIRTLDMVGRDLADDWLEGEAALQALLTGAAEVRAAAGAMGRLEIHLV